MTLSPVMIEAARTYLIRRLAGESLKPRARPFLSFSVPSRLPG